MNNWMMRNKVRERAVRVRSRRLKAAGLSTTPMLDKPEWHVPSPPIDEDALNARLDAWLAAELKRVDEWHKAELGKSEK